MLCAKFINADCGYDSDKQKVRDAGLELGRKYEVRHVEMGGWHTNVWLEGYKGSFNSVHFDFYVDDTPHDIYDDPDYNPYLHD